MGPANQRLLLRPTPAQRENRTIEMGRKSRFGQPYRNALRPSGHGLLPGAIRKGADGAPYFRVHDPEGNLISFVRRPSPRIGYAAAPKQISSHLIHAGFVVKDMSAENRFYVDLLGFRLYWYGGFKDDGTDWYELQVPDGPDWIEYMLNIPANADHKELGVRNHFSWA